ncbi:MAG: hypothetical protein ACTS73_06425 [Arsenophonus sp. NEOnobi-MAG3]
MLRFKCLRAGGDPLLQRNMFQQFVANTLFEACKNVEVLLA